ncbi:MAG: serine/threonine-protein kinase [Burkholderiales bacterium]
MRELWSQAFREFEKLSALTATEADARLRELQEEQPELAKLVERIRSQPAISLQPIPWAGHDGNAAAPGTSGARLGAYTLIREIGRGGSGSVWLGERADGLYHGQVAIKLLSAPLLHDVSNRQRFAREGELLARLSHPNIARLLDAGTSDEGARYLVLEYVDGVALGEYCASEGLGIEATIKLFCQAVDAVAYSHAQLILHRDIKPGNMLVTASGELKLLDFGLGKLLHEDEEPLVVAADVTRMLGIGYTPRYASPEQMRGSGMTTASDVYSLGVTLYELLTGAPFESRENYTRPSERLATSTTRSTWSRRVRGDIDSIIAKAVSEAPEERYVNAAALGDDLRRFLNHEPVTAQPDTTLYRAGKFVRRHRLAVGASLLTTLAVIAALSLSVVQTIEATRQKERAEQEAKLRGQMTDFVTHLLSQYAPSDKPITTAELLKIGIQKVPTVFADDPVTASRMTQRLAEHLMTVRGHGEDALAAQMQAIEQARKAGDDAQLVDATSFLADIQIRLAKTDDASRSLKEAADLLQRIPNRHPRRSELEDNLLQDQAMVATITGDAPLASKTADALVARRNRFASASVADEIAAWNRISLAYNTAMRYSDALAAHDKSWPLFRSAALTDGQEAISDHVTRLTSLLDARDPGSAVRFIEEQIKPNSKVPLQQLPNQLLSRIIRSYATHGDVARARELLEARLASLDRSKPVPLSIALAHFELCMVQGDATCTSKLEAEAARNFEVAHRAPQLVVGRHWVTASSARAAGQADRAMRAIETGVREIAANVSAPSPYYAPLLLERSRLQLAAGDAALARKSARDALDYLQRHQRYDPLRCLWRGDLLLVIAQAANTLGASDESAVARREAEQILRNVLTTAAADTRLQR